jgi:hypothetical protein
VRLACADPVPPELHFLPGHEAYTADGPGDEQLILVVDASDLERIGRVYRADRFAAVPVVNIDHHVTNLRFGDLNYLDPKASTAELILDLLTAWGAEIDKIVATCLLTGMVTDTRGFRTNSATAEVLRATLRWWMPAPHCRPSWMPCSITARWSCCAYGDWPWPPPRCRWRVVGGGLARDAAPSAGHPRAARGWPIS